MENIKDKGVLLLPAVSRVDGKSKSEEAIIEEISTSPNAPEVLPEKKRKRRTIKLRLVQAPPSCHCYHQHDEVIPCQDSRMVVSKIISTSGMVTIFVGREKEPFSVHLGLLKLYSGFFRKDLGRTLKAGTPTLIQIKSKLLAEFHSWIYTGSSLLSEESTTVELAEIWIGLWQMGELLEAPTFQNFFWNKYRKWCQQNTLTWPSISGISLIYKLTKEDSQLHKFAAHSVACKPPLAINQEASAEHEAWRSFIVSCPDLAVDILLKNKKWEGTHAWDDVHVGEYLVPEKSAEDRWDEMISEESPNLDLQVNAKGTSRRNKIELAHFMRGGR